jgi:hypothetical protein
MKIYGLFRFYLLTPGKENYRMINPQQCGKRLSLENALDFRKTILVSVPGNEE